MKIEKVWFQWTSTFLTSPKKAYTGKPKRYIQSELEMSTWRALSRVGKTCTDLPIINQITKSKLFVESLSFLSSIGIILYPIIEGRTILLSLLYWVIDVMGGIDGGPNPMPWTLHMNGLKASTGLSKLIETYPAARRHCPNCESILCPNPMAYIEPGVDLGSF